MTCRDVRELADSFLGEKLPTETHYEILRHLDTCPACRTDIAERQRLRETVRLAFTRAPDLQAAPDFAVRLRDAVREASARQQRSWTPPRTWLALAAGIVLAIGLTGAVVLKRPASNRSLPPSDALALDAIGDHRNCALGFRLLRAPVPLEDAAERFDQAYRLLLDEPPDDIATPGGVAHVVERHSCAYGARRFGHVVLRYRGRVVSLLMTARDGVAGLPDTDTAIPHVIGRPTDGLSVVAVDGPRHAFLLVSDLGRAELAELSSAVSLPLARRREARVDHPRSRMTAVRQVRRLVSPVLSIFVPGGIAFANTARADNVCVQAADGAP